MKHFAFCAAILLCLPAAMCKTTAPGFPPAADVQAVTEAKPVPTEAILTDPAANDRYNAAIESWGDRVSAAGARLCRYFRDLGMEVDCPKGD